MLYTALSSNCSTPLPTPYISLHTPSIKVICLQCTSQTKHDAVLPPWKTTAALLPHDLQSVPQFLCGFEVVLLDSKHIQSNSCLSGFTLIQFGLRPHSSTQASPTFSPHLIKFLLLISAPWLHPPPNWTPWAKSPRRCQQRWFSDRMRCRTWHIWSGACGWGLRTSLGSSGDADIGGHGCCCSLFWLFALVCIIRRGVRWVEYRALSRGGGRRAIAIINCDVRGRVGERWWKSTRNSNTQKIGNSKEMTFTQ